MIFTLTFTENDYLIAALYNASKKNTVRQTRIRAWLIIVACFIVLGLVFTVTKNPFFQYYFFAFALISLVFYPFYQRYKYKKHYQKHIAESVQYRIGKASTVELTKDKVKCNDVTGETMINISELSEINEIGTHIFLKFKSGESLIIPKRQINESELWLDLTPIINDNGVKVNKELNWKWK